MNEMKALLDAEARKRFGNDLQLSELLEPDPKLITEMFQSMADSLAESIYVAGYKPVANTQRVITADSSPVSPNAQLGLTLKAAFTSEPAQFVAYCGYKMDEFRRKADGLLAENTRLRLILAKYNLPDHGDDE